MTFVIPDQRTDCATTQAIVHLKLYEITLFHIGSSAYQILSPLRKRLVIIMQMMHELQKRATGTIFIVENWNFQILFSYIKAVNPKKEILPLTVGGTSGESNIASLWKDHFSAIANSVGSTNNRDQVMNALGTVPGHNDVINVHDLRQM